MTEKSKDESKDAKKDKAQPYQKPPFLEWLIAALGLILVTGAIGFMIYKAATHENLPPNFVFKVDSATKTPNGFLVKFELENTGGETAADIAIEGELMRGEGSIEKSSAAMTYAPPHSKREGGLYFTKNPSEFELKIRVAGYEKP